MTYQSSTSKKPAWSYSALTAFETCPRRYYLTRVAKSVVEPQNEAAVWGSTVHKHIEERLLSRKPLPEYLATYEPMLQKIDNRNGKKIVEERLTLNKSYMPTTWMAKDAWCRCVVDAGVLGSKKGALLDWKTGKKKEDSDQLKLFAAVAFSHYPWLETVSTGFVWLKDGSITKEVFTRDHVPGIWDEFNVRVNRLYAAYDNNTWQAKPSGLCRSWCPVGKANCEFCGG